MFVAVLFLVVLAAGLTRGDHGSGPALCGLLELGTGSPELASHVRVRSRGLGAASSPPLLHPTRSRDHGRFVARCGYAHAWHLTTRSGLFPPLHARRQLWRFEGDHPPFR